MDPSFEGQKTKDKKRLGNQHRLIHPITLLGINEEENSYVD